MVDLHEVPEETREIGLLGRPIKLRANDHLTGLGSLCRKLDPLTASTCPISISCNSMPLGFPWALAPCLGPDMPLQAQPNHMVPTLADTEGSSLDLFRKGACSPNLITWSAQAPTNEAQKQ